MKLYYTKSANAIIDEDTKRILEDNGVDIECLSINDLNHGPIKKIGQIAGMNVFSINFPKVEYEEEFGIELITNHSFDDRDWTKEPESKSKSKSKGIIIITHPKLSHTAIPTFTAFDEFTDEKKYMSFNEISCREIKDPYKIFKEKLPKGFNESGNRSFDHIMSKQRKGKK